MPDGLDVIAVAVIGLLGAWIQSRVRQLESVVTQLRDGLVAALDYTVELRDHISDGLPPPPPDPPAHLAAALMVMPVNRRRGMPAAKD